MAIAKYAYTALDCENPIALAEFYSKITGWAVEPLGDFAPEDVTWLELLDEEGKTKMGFQKIDNYRRPTWPEGDVSQQLHLDFHVLDMEKARAEIIAIGAVQAEFQSAEHYQVFFDPEGHPFCLIAKESF
jgi:hypothetical protein